MLFCKCCDSPVNRVTRSKAKRIAKKWLSERPVEQYGREDDQLDDHLRIGWWVYTNTKGDLLCLQAVEVYNLC